MRFLKDNKIIVSGLLSVAVVELVLFLHFDTVVVLWARDLHRIGGAHSILDVVNPLMNVVSNGVTLIIAAFLLYAIGRYKNPGLYPFGRSLLIGLLSAGISVQILKHLIGRARPRLTDNVIFIGPSLKSGYDSFPSGHSTLAFCLAYVASKYYPRYSAAFYLFAITVALYRIDCLAHFPSDVLAGAVVGVSVAKLTLSKTAGRTVSAEYPG